MGMRQGESTREREGIGRGGEEEEEEQSALPLVRAWFRRRVPVPLV